MSTGGIGPEACNAVKREWVAQFLQRPCGGGLRRAAREHRRRLPGGDAARQRSGSQAVIDLIGVDGRYQGHGIGAGSLSQHFIREWHGRVDRLVVGTQATTYGDASLSIPRLPDIETSYVLHAHLLDGRVAA